MQFGEKSAYLANSLLKHVKFLVDRFHVEGHTEPCCKLPSIDDPEKGRYHPSNKEFALFLCNLEKKGAYLANFLLKHMKFLVDRFHVEGHTEPCCKLPSIDDPEKGRYHPSNKEFAEIKDANTECAEQSFKCTVKN